MLTSQKKTVFFIKFYQFVMKHNDSQSTFSPEDKRLAILLLNVSWLSSDSVLTHTALRPSFKAATPAYPVELPISTTVSPFPGEMINKPG